MVDKSDKLYALYPKKLDSVGKGRDPKNHILPVEQNRIEKTLADVRLCVVAYG